LRQSASNVPVSSRAIASISSPLRILGEGRSPFFCRFRPHARFVTSGQIFVTCCHADGRTEMPTPSTSPRRRDKRPAPVPLGRLIC
jgi:hypothetical protein